jgi:hypothetical protein
MAVERESFAGSLFCLPAPGAHKTARRAAVFDLDHRGKSGFSRLSCLDASSPDRSGPEFKTRSLAAKQGAHPGGRLAAGMGVFFVAPVFRIAQAAGAGREPR